MRQYKVYFGFRGSADPAEDYEGGVRATFASEGDAWLIAREFFKLESVNYVTVTVEELK